MQSSENFCTKRVKGLSLFLLKPGILNHRFWNILENWEIISISYMDRDEELGSACRFQFVELQRSLISSLN